MASQLAEAHIEGERRLRELASWGVGQAWRGLPGYNRENIDQFLASAVPIVSGAQRQSIAWTDAYLAHYLGRAPLGVGADDLIANAVRPGVGIPEVYSRPFVTVWNALSEGKPYQDAVNAGLARAQSNAAMDVQMAMRSTAAEVQKADPQIERFQRVADGGACSFCQEVDGAVLLDADAMPLHNNCGCGIEPLTEPVEPTPVSDAVSVEEHGELGPMLTDPSHDFTSEAQID